MKQGSDPSFDENNGVGYIIALTWAPVNAMRFITNKAPNRHVDVINKLIPFSKTIILCSGWLDSGGIKKILGNLVDAANRGATVTIYSNKEHTKDAAMKAISMYQNIDHVIVDKSRKYLHSKIYYFEQEKTYAALVGSANITSGGLGKNEELSVELSGDIGDPDHTTIVEYLNELEMLR